MKKYDSKKEEGKQEENESRSVMEEILRNGAQKMLQKAIEWEVSEYLLKNEKAKDEEGYRLVVKNGWRKPRNLQTGIGDIEIEQPRVNDKREGRKFVSNIIPKYARRSPSIEALIPALYLAGVSSNNFKNALESILGKKAKGLSAGSILRLKTIWEKEYQEWSKRDLSMKQYVYWWADGIYFNVRLSDERPCFLVIMGALIDGTKELITIWDGERESKLSWKEALSDLKKRGLKEAPKLAIGDGGLGFWAAMEEEY